MDKEKVIISAMFDTKLVDRVTDYRSFCQTPACEALLSAYQKYEVEPKKEVWIGESKESPGIVAVIERSDKDTSLVATVYDEDIFLSCIT